MASNLLPSTPPEKQKRVVACKAFLLQWCKLMWFDLASMAVIGGLTYAVYRSPVPVIRTFPVTFNGTGDIVYPQLAYPYRGWIIPSWLSGLVSFLVPLSIFALAQFRIRSAWDFSSAIVGTTWAILLGSLAQVVIKQLVGGFRPHFLAVCQPDTSLASAVNNTGLNGVGFHSIMYTTEICTNPDKQMIKTAITAFPSGHSVAAFSSYGFLFLWLNAKLKVWADHKPAFWKLMLTLLPLLAALYIVCTLTVDGAHSWYDIVVGSFIGLLTAIASYRSSYAAVWDWRYNHLPLQPLEAFQYGTRRDMEYAGQTFTRRAGWGARMQTPFETRVVETNRSGLSQHQATSDEANNKGRRRKTMSGAFAV
ncbi:1,3-beta-glucanosyltransferase [Paramyrothecium foliicola]|nr:1,3-beta-glucanosyltransferase [Paramyrothecium foliicola]